MWCEIMHILYMNTLVIVHGEGETIKVTAKGRKLKPWAKIEKRNH